MESTTYRFAKCLQKRFGIIKGVTDKNYITNSYHVHVSEKIDAFKKLKGTDVSEDEIQDLEDQIQKLTDKYIKEVDAAVDAKSKEDMTV